MYSLIDLSEFNRIKLALESNGVPTDIVEKSIVQEIFFCTHLIVSRYFNNDEFEFMKLLKNIGRYTYEESLKEDVDGEIKNKFVKFNSGRSKMIESKKFRKGLNEGPGAGYTVSSNRYALQGDVGMVSVKKNDTHYIITATCDFVGTVKEFSAEGYYSGTGEQKNLPIKLE
jgi:hypothetical protein